MHQNTSLLVSEGKGEDHAATLLPRQDVRTASKDGGDR